MKKQDIIRIINEEIEFALEEQEKQLYKVVDDKGKTIQPDESSDVDGLIKKIATKLAAKNPKWSVEKINEMYDPIYDSMIPEIAAMLMAGIAGVIKAFKYLKSKGLSDQTIISILNKAKEKVKGNVNENEGMTKSLKDIDANLSLTKFDTTPPSFKITYMKKEDLSKELEEEIVAWILSKGGKIKSVSTQFDWDDDRYNYPTVYFKF